MSNPRVLLLDEPTNHTDIETIDWLEGFLKTFNGTIIFISHDRSFIRNMATRIVDLDRGKLVTYPEITTSTCWKRRSPARGRTTKCRVRSQTGAGRGVDPPGSKHAVPVMKAAYAPKAMRRERGERREVMGTAKMQVEEASRSGKIVFEMEDVCYRSTVSNW